MGSKSLKGRAMCMADGGTVQNETPEQLMARMAAKYKIASADTPQPAPKQEPSPAQKAAGQGIVALLKGRGQQIDRAAGYAEGGIVARFKGKGGPVDDEIPVKVAGQNINVSNGEKAVVLPVKTAKNPQAVSAIEDIIEQTNGKPTNRQGNNFAAGGALVTEETLTNGPYTSEPGLSPVRAFKGWQDKKIAETNAKIDIATGKIPPPAPAQQPTKPVIQQPIQQPGVATPEPVKQTTDAQSPVADGLSVSKMPAGSKAPNVYDEMGNKTAGGDISGQKLYTKVGGTQGMSAMDAPLASVPASSPIPTVPGLSLSQRAGNPNLGTADDNVRQLENIQKANSMMTPQGGASFIADPNEAANAEKTARWRQDELIGALKQSGNRHGKSALGQALAAEINGQNSLAAETLRQQTARDAQSLNANNAAVTQGLTRRAQDQAAARDAERNRIDELRLAGNPLDNQARQLEINQKTRINTLQEQAVNGKTDEEKQAARQSLAALGIGAKAQDEYDARVVESWDKGTKNGEQVVTYNKRTGQQVNQSAPSAKPSFEDYAAHVRGNNKGQQVTDDQIKAAYAKQFGAA